MSILTRLTPSAEYRQSMYLSGFDPDNPNKRHVPNHQVFDLNLLTKQTPINRVCDYLLNIWTVTLVGFMLSKPVFADSMLSSENDRALTAAIVFAFVLFALVGMNLSLITRAQTHHKPEPENTKPKHTETEHSLSRRQQKTDFTWRFDGHTRTGLVRSENQDAICFEKISANKGIQIVCDGAGGQPGGREAANKAASWLLDEVVASYHLAPINRLAKAISKVRQRFEVERLEGITTAIVCIFDKDWMDFATLGDGGLSVIWPDGMTSEVLVPHHVLGEPSNIITGYIGQANQTPPRIGSIRLEPGSLVLASSDGVSDLLDIEALAAARPSWESQPTQPGLAEQWLVQLENARDLQTQAYYHSDNMTLGLAFLSREGQ